MERQLNIHPEMQEMIQAANFWPPQESLEGERAFFSDFCLSLGRPRPREITADDYLLPGGDGDIAVRMYRPLAGPRDLPCVVFFHGGGWVFGGLDANDSIAWGLAEGIGAAVASVEYRLAPEHRYPAAFQDCYNVTRHIWRNPQEFSIDPKRIALAGEGSGGNLAAAVALASRDRGEPEICAEALVCPVLWANLKLPSYEENAEAPLLTKTEMKAYLKAYLGDVRGDIPGYGLPMLAEDLSSMPPTLVHTAQYDPLRDEGRIFAMRLRKSGTRTSFRTAAQMTHGFMRARFAGPDSASEFRFVCDFLKRHLAG